MAIRIFDDAAVVRHVIAGGGRYALWLGVGTSADSGIQTVNDICKSIRASELQNQTSIDIKDAAAVEDWANKTLDWNERAFAAPNTVLLRAWWSSLCECVQ